MSSVLFQVARCTKIINADSEDAKYIINVKQFAKFVVDLAEQVQIEWIFIEKHNITKLLIHCHSPEGCVLQEMSQSYL